MMLSTSAVLVTLRLEVALIAKRFSDVECGDIEALIANAVCESSTLEFKRDLPGTSDEAKREFLADISALANTAGGDILYGINELDGCAAAIVDISTADIDAEILRLNGVILTGLEPRIRHSTAVFNCTTGRVLLVRVEKSWNGPHRVNFRGHDRFYGRTSAGKYALDVQQLRRAFVDNITVAERLRAFRAERLAAVIGGATPMPMSAGPKLIVHALPFESFLSELDHDLARLPYESFRPLNAGGWSDRITFEGRLVTAVQNDNAYSYTHVYRSGLIEMVESRLLSRTFDDGARAIPSVGLGNVVIDGARKALTLLQAIGVEAPVALGVTLTDVRGGRLAIDDWRWEFDHSAILNEHLFLPEVLFQNLETSVGPGMRIAIDRVWNACGVKQCPFFDAEGNWTPPR